MLKTESQLAQHNFQVLHGKPGLRLDTFGERAGIVLRVVREQTGQLNLSVNFNRVTVRHDRGRALFE